MYTIIIIGVTLFSLLAFATGICALAYSKSVFVCVTYYVIVVVRFEIRECHTCVLSTAVS